MSVWKKQKSGLICRVNTKVLNEMIHAISYDVCSRCHLKKYKDKNKNNIVSHIPLCRILSDSMCLHKIKRGPTKPLIVKNIEVAEAAYNIKGSHI